MKRLALALTLAGCFPAQPDLHQVCLETGEAWCRRAAECGVGSAACREEFGRGCCVDLGTCGRVARPGFDLSRCVAELRRASCESLKQGVMPGGCR